MASDPYWNNVVLAMHMDDVGLTDVKGHAITKNGTAARSTTQSKAGGGSAYFDASAGCYVSTPYSADFAFGSGDFTIECWMYKLGNNANTSRIWNPDGDYFDGISIGVDATGKITFGVSYTGAAWDVSCVSAAVVTNNSWHHIAVVRQGASLFSFDNGVKTIGSTALGTSSLYTNTTKARVIGNQSGTSRPFYGYIDDFRITKGVARYTVDFSASLPAAPFPDRALWLSGTVRDPAGNLCSRTVRAYRRSDGALIGSAVSNATTGVYSIPTLDETTHYVTCLDSGSENALIFDNITPL